MNRKKKGRWLEVDGLEEAVRYGEEMLAERTGFMVMYWQPVKRTYLAPGSAPATQNSRLEQKEAAATLGMQELSDPG